MCNCKPQNPCQLSSEIQEQKYRKCVARSGLPKLDGKILIIIMQKTPKKQTPKTKTQPRHHKRLDIKQGLEKKHLKDGILNTDLALTNYNLNMPRFFLFLSLS